MSAMQKEKENVEVAKLSGAKVVLLCECSCWMLIVLI